MPIDFPTAKYADPTTFPPASPASTDAVMARTSGGADKSFVLGNLAGLAPLVLAADQSAYYNGSVWAAYTVTSVGRTLLAATTQPLQRTALGLGDAAVQNIGTSGANVPLLNAANTWSGAQTYQGNITVNNGGPSLFLSHTNGNQVRFWNPGTTVTLSNTVSSVTTNYLAIDMAAGVVFFRGNSVPAGDNLYSSGQSGNRWSVVWAATGTISTSDAREKTPVRPLTDPEIAAAEDLIKEIGSFQWLTAVEEKGDAGARFHIGMTVQRAIEVMESHGLQAERYGFICKDSWEDSEDQWISWEAEEAQYQVIAPAVLDEAGEEIEAAVLEMVKPAVEAGRSLIQAGRKAGYRYGFRETPLIMFMMAGQRAAMERARAEHDALEARVAALEAGRTP